MPFKKRRIARCFRTARSFPCGIATASATDTARDSADLAPILKACLFETNPPPSPISARTLAMQCVVRYIHRLWLDPKVLYRSNADILGLAKDNLLQHPAASPFPISCPPSVAK